MTRSNSPSEHILVGMVQLNSTEDWQTNLSVIETAMHNLQQCDLIVLPELAPFRPKKPSNFSHAHIASMYTECLSHLKQFAQTNHTWLIAGSMIEPTATSQYFNTTHVLSPTGELMGSYRKIHLFQATVDGTTLNESDRFLPGHQPLMCTINGWRIGFTICFDLRFPELFRWYAAKSADIIVVPSSFTHTTGNAHWYTLCQARAIENQCYIVAPNQTGIGANNVKSYGHSLMIGPTGGILQSLGDTETSTAYESFHPRVINHARSAIPMRQQFKC